MKLYSGLEHFDIKHKEIFLEINFLKSIVLPQKGLKDLIFKFFAALILFVGASPFVLFLNTPLDKLAFYAVYDCSSDVTIDSIGVVNFSVCSSFVISVISYSTMLVLIAFLMRTFVDLLYPVCIVYYSVVRCFIHIFWHQT